MRQPIASLGRPAQRILLGLSILCPIAWTPSRAAAAAQAPVEDGSVLIRDVRLVDRDDPTKDVAVEIVLRDGRLDLVTRDAVAVDSVDLAFDADGGFLLGRLQRGESPSFIVLSMDPRADFDVLLDTDKYTTLAVEDGRIVRNLLLPAPPPPAGTAPARTSGWLAYNPPPVTLPLRYDAGIPWNAWDTKWVTGAFIGALVVDRMNWQSQDDASQFQVGDLNEFDGGEIRALRFGSVGTLNLETPWTYTLFAATNAFDKGFDTERNDDLTLFDARLDIPVFEGGVLSVGKQKEPISLERLSGGVYLPMQERSVAADGLLPARNIGVVLSGMARADDMTWAFGVFNDWLDDGGSISDGSTQLVGRVTGLPFYSADESNLLHLGFGVRRSDAEEGGGFLTEPEFNQSENFIETGAFAADSMTTYDVEAAWLRGPLWVSAEYLWSDVDAPALGSPRPSGHDLTAAWNLTGEMRAYNRRSGVFAPVPISRSVQDGGSGTWEATLRWSSLDTNDAGFSGGDVEVYSAGLNWWLNQKFIFSVNYRWIDLDRMGVDGSSHGVLTRIVLML